jgi:hypothetical protein
VRATAPTLHRLGLTQPSDAACRLDEHVLDQILDLVGAPVEEEE